MNLKTWLQQERGRRTALAQRLGVSLSYMCQIADEGVPIKYMESIRDFTGGIVTLECMVRQRASRAESKALAKKTPAHA